MWTHDAILSEIRYGRNDAHHVLEALAELSTDKLTRDVIAAHFARTEESDEEGDEEGDEEEMSNFLRTGARSDVMPVHPPCEAIPSREEVEFPENGHIIICGPGHSNMRKRYLRCPSCQCITEMVVQDGGYWGVEHMCCRCGDAWQDGELRWRPFKPRWRRDAIARHRHMWDLATHGPFDNPSGEAS